MKPVVNSIGTNERINWENKTTETFQKSTFCVGRFGLGVKKLQVMDDVCTTDDRFHFGHFNGSKCAAQNKAAETL